MQREICFCGRHGLIIDRLPAYVGDGEWALACPECGDLERLAFLRSEERHAWLVEAAARQVELRTGPWPDQRFARSFSF